MKLIEIARSKWNWDWPHALNFSTPISGAFRYLKNEDDGEDTGQVEQSLAFQNLTVEVLVFW
jgi:hypothetical protein